MWRNNATFQTEREREKEHHRSMGFLSDESGRSGDLLLFFNRFPQKPYCAVGSFLPRYATINSASLPVPGSWMGLRYHSIGGGKEKMLVRNCTVALLLHQIRRKIERYSCELFSSAVGTDSSRPHERSND